MFTKLLFSNYVAVDPEFSVVQMSSMSINAQDIRWLQIEIIGGYHVQF